MSFENVGWAWRMELPAATKLVLFWMCDSTWERDPYSASVADMAAFAGIEVDEIREILLDLQARDLVEVLGGLGTDRVRVIVKVPVRVSLEREQRQRRDDTGYVYFLHAPELGRIKIGTSKTPFVRTTGLSRQSPVKCILLKVVRGGRMLEARLHDRFAASRSVGEWFDATAELLAYIESLPAEKAA